MKKILLLCFILFFGQISIAQSPDKTYVPADTVILERERPEVKPQEKVSEPKPETQVEKPKTKTPQTQRAKKTKKVTYPNLKIYDEPKNKPCQKCYYEYKGEVKRPKKTYTAKRRKAMTRKEKEEKIKEITEKMNDMKPLFSIEKTKPYMKKRCLD